MIAFTIAVLCVFSGFSHDVARVIPNSQRQATASADARTMGFEASAAAAPAMMQSGKPAEPTQTGQSDEPGRPQPAKSQTPRSTEAPGPPEARVAPVELGRKALEARERGTKYLIAAQQEDGGWSKQNGPGVAGMVLWALIREPHVGPNHPAVKRGVEYLLKSQRDDGGIYSQEGLVKNYESSIALSAFAAMNLPENAERIRKLQKFLIDNQFDENDGKSVDDPFYGGSGYGSGKRPDLSNTQIMLDALKDSGLPADDPAYKRALVFVKRCQMLAESNDQAFAKGSTQGGFIYSPANGGESKAAPLEVNGRQELRCYGSMTYAGFKSLLYCGVSKDDPKVKAALEWIREHWTLDHNPNMPDEQSKQGLYYYYHVFGRAMRAWGEPRIKDAAGKEHDWRAEVTEKLVTAQRPDGSWVNEADRWMEGNPALVTAYAILTLQDAGE